jgi:hypothetical protein
MVHRKFTRREILKISGSTAASEMGTALLSGCAIGGGGGNPPPTTCAKLTGSYRGVRGFSDKSAAFEQPDPANTGNPPTGILQPFHLDTSHTNAACTHDITHD